MDKSTLDYIKFLTERDPKGLMGKLAKLTEEAGELSRVIQPYENSFGTNHRFVNKKQIVEEIADCTLVLLSMLYDKNICVDYEEFQQTLLEKANDWITKQNKELKIVYPLPYEIHVTVEADSDRLDQFKTACYNLGVKPIYLDLNANDNVVIKDLMTSSVFKGNNGESIREVERISQGLVNAGFNVIREKIETVPWHPAAPRDYHNKMPCGCYFECHFQVEVCENSAKNNHQKLIETISSLNFKSQEFYVGGYNLHTSKNVFKKLLTGNDIVMVTYRDYVRPHIDFDMSVGYIESALKEQFNVEKTIIEFCIYDTKISHDKEWLKH